MEATIRFSFFYRAAIKLLQFTGPLNLDPRDKGSRREDGILHSSEEQDRKCTYDITLRGIRIFVLWTLLRWSGHLIQTSNTFVVHNCTLL